MRAGARRHQVSFETPAETVNAEGATVTTWTHVFETRASIEALSGRELFAAQQVQSEVNHKLNIRWRPGVDATMRIRDVKDGSIFDIGAVQPDATLRREIILLCIKRISEGWRRGE